MRVSRFASLNRKRNFSLVVASVSRLSERILQDSQKTQATLDKILDEPTFPVPKPDFSILKQSDIVIQRKDVLGDTLPNIDPFSLVADDISNLNNSVKKILASETTTALGSIARYFFEHNTGKKMRPALVLLFARALNNGIIYPPQRRLAEITEMIHTASLLHDDVIDKAETRRGIATAHQLFGNKRAVLAGDLLLARASVCLARLRNVDAVEVLSTVVGDMVKGEVMQMSALAPNENSPDQDIVFYLMKNFYKTGSLIANSLLATVFLSPDILPDRRKSIERCAFRYGEAIGQAFQLIDDALDFEGSLMTLGKPSLADVQLGIATYPVLIASRKYPELVKMIERKFQEPGDVEHVLLCVQYSDSVSKTRELAMNYCKKAADIVREGLDPSPDRDALIRLAGLIAERKT